MHIGIYPTLANSNLDNHFSVASRHHQVNLETLLSSERATATGEGSERLMAENDAPLGAGCRRTHLPRPPKDFSQKGESS